MQVRVGDWSTVYEVTIEPEATDNWPYGTAYQTVYVSVSSSGSVSTLHSRSARLSAAAESAVRETIQTQGHP